MATESKNPPPPSTPTGADAAPQTPGPETITPAKQDETTKPAEQESASESFTKSITSTVEPMREEHVQNAVKFLSHPKVRGSPVIHRRSFLEKKGLTREEIEEAFRRVPDPPSNATSVEATTSNQATRQTSTTSLQPQVPTTISQHASVPLGGVPPTHTMQQYRFPWYHAFLAVGILAASGAGTAVLVKNTILPRFKAWIRKIVREEDDSEKKEISKPDPVEEAVEAAKSAASAAAIMAKTSEELLNARTEERKCSEAFKDLLNAQMKEMKSISSAVHKLESTREVTFSYDKELQEHNMHASGKGFTDRNSYVDQVDPRSLSMVSQQGKSNGMQEVNSDAVRPSTAPVSGESTGAPYSKSYMEIMAMIQRGETPPGIKEINDMPPNPNQLPTNPRVAPRSKPWGDSQRDQMRRDLGFQPQSISDEYLERQGNGRVSDLNGKPLESHENSWEQKNIKITDIEPEIEEPRVMSHGLGSSERRGRWVPPQPPKVVIPEAAVAIRQPKPAAPKQPVENEQPKTQQEMPQPPTAEAEVQPVENEQRMIQQEMSQPPVAKAAVVAGQPYSFAHKQPVEAGTSGLTSGGNSSTEAVTSSYYSEIQEEPAVGVEVN